MKLLVSVFFSYYGHLGYGGGYNEREGVEYIQREDSDDEFDEVLDNNTYVQYYWVTDSKIHFCALNKIFGAGMVQWW